MLPYSAVRTAPDPDARLLAFLDSTFTAASTTGTWPQIELSPAATRGRRVPASRQVRPPVDIVAAPPPDPELRIRRFDPSTGREPIMDFATQLENLKKRVDDTVTQVKKAAAEDRTQLEARIDKAQLDADLALKDSQQSFDANADQAQSKWTQIKADAAGKVADAKAKVHQRGKEMDFQAAETDAELAESEASAAIDFASWAADNARLAVLDALDARAYASELAKKVAPGAG